MRIRTSRLCRRLHLPRFPSRAFARLCREQKAHSGAEADCDFRCSGAKEMIEIAKEAGILLGVVSQKRYNDASLVPEEARLKQERLGRLD